MTDLNPVVGGEKLHTAKEVAAMLNVVPQTIYAWVEDGRIGHYRIGGRTIRIGENHLRKFLRETESEFQRASEREPVEIDWRGLRNELRQEARS
jgi:excisionase family DNA binding protein